MTKRTELYKCDICGNIVEIMHTGAPALVCCDEKMKLLEENTVDAALEKHVPVIEKIDGGYKIIVGEVEHPMTTEHFIEWIELIAGNKVYAQFLNPGEKPEALFKIDAREVSARAYCNIHGSWKSNN